MKKLMLVFAAVAIATSMQAADVLWSSGVFTGPGGASSKTGSAYSDVYSAVFSVYSDSAGANLITSETTTDVTKKGLMKGSVDISKPNPGQTVTYYTQLVITDKATGKVLDSGMGSFTWSGDALSDPSVEFFGSGAGGFDTLPPNAGNTAAGSWGAAGAPEPTSGILMLVGLGALALRRRKA